MIGKGSKSGLPGALQREAGDLMKGESVLPPGVRAASQIKQFVMARTDDGSGALKAVLCQIVDSETERVATHRDTPLDALAEILDRLLANDFLLEDFVRRVDAHWGAMTMERPYFERPGQPPHPDDPHTRDSVRRALRALRNAIDPGTA